LWIFNYKYPEECTKDFFTINKFTGFVQRSEDIKGLNRFSFTSMCILKLNDLFHIHGVWLFRGQELPKEFLEVDDTNYFTWSKFDITNADQKSLISDFLCQESLTNWNGLGEFVSGKVWGC